MPLDHLFGAEQHELVLYASRLEWMLEEAARLIKRERADAAYGDSLQAEFSRARYQLVLRERERTAA